jgi:hypothetical protein
MDKSRYFILSLIGLNIVLRSILSILLTYSLICPGFLDDFFLDPSIPEEECIPPKDVYGYKRICQIRSKFLDVRNDTSKHFSDYILEYLSYTDPIIIIINKNDAAHILAITLTPIYISTIILDLKGSSAGMQVFGSLQIMNIVYIIFDFVFASKELSLLLIPTIFMRIYFHINPSIFFLLIEFIFYTITLVSIPYSFRLARKILHKNATNQNKDNDLPTYEDVENSELPKYEELESQKV